MRRAPLSVVNGLLPWDSWKDPNYLDALLVAPDKKPIERIVLKRSE